MAFCGMRRLAVVPDPFMSSMQVLSYFIKLMSLMKLMGAGFVLFCLEPDSFRGSYNEMRL